MRQPKKGPWTAVWTSQVVLVNNPPANTRNSRDAGSILGLGRSPGGGNGNTFQCSCLENSMDREAWQPIVHGVTKSQTWLSDWACTHTHTHTHTHTPAVCVLQWRHIQYNKIKPHCLGCGNQCPIVLATHPVLSSCAHHITEMAFEMRQSIFRGMGAGIPVRRSDSRNGARVQWRSGDETSRWLPESW